MIGILIADLLKANDDLIALVPEISIFPYVANENTPLPLIVYTIDSLNPEYNKDGWIGDICNFSVISISDNYANLQLIVKQIREALELKKGIYTRRIILTGLQEYNIAENMFMNKLNLSVNIFDY